MTCDERPHPTAEANSLSKAFRQACGADRDGQVIFVAECHVRRERLGAVHCALGERLDGRIDRIVHYDTGSCLSERGCPSLLCEPLADVSEDYRDQPLAQPYHGGRSL